MAETTTPTNVDNSSRTSGDRAGSGNSGGTMSVVSRTTGKTRKTTEEISDRKKIKVLKQAMKDERASKAVI